MSDTKWRKLFAALDRPDLELRQALVKFVDADEVHLFATPTLKALHPPKPFVDSLKFGPISLRSIEWIEFPKIAKHQRASPPDGRGRLPPQIVRQDLDKAEEIISSMGRYPVERTENGLKIVGHKR